MRLTRYTDYAMRTLIYLATHDGRQCSIAEVVGAYRISQNHLMKVVNDLSRAGYVASQRGRSGGIRLARPADQINVGEVVRHTEGDFQLVECGGCLIRPACGLTCVLQEALGAFMAVLDRHTLADLSAARPELLKLFTAAAQDRRKEHAR